MKKFEIAQRIDIWSVYTIEAKTEKEALKKWRNGEILNQKTESASANDGEIEINELGVKND